MGKMIVNSIVPMFNIKCLVMHTVRMHAGAITACIVCLCPTIEALCLYEFKSYCRIFLLVTTKKMSERQCVRIHAVHQNKASFFVKAYTCIGIKYITYLGQRKKTVFRVTRLYLNLLVKPRFFFHVFWGV